MLKSLLRQKTQIRSSSEYKDLNYFDGNQGLRELDGDIHSQSYAESVKSLEDDLNILRTQLREIIGRGTWYDEAPISLTQLKLELSQKQSELELLLKHEEMYHHKRNDNTEFEYYPSGDISSMKIFSEGNLRQVSNFEFENETLQSITTTIWDKDLQEYVKQKKIFYFDSEGNLLNIENTLIS
jgi:hypothetical protein